MTFLLDTHTLLWFLQDDPKLSPMARGSIQGPTHRVLVSIVSCWELAIKASLGKMNFSEPVAALIKRELPANRLELLPISLEHLTAVEHLPPHHKDPFDWLLIAQAIVEGVAVVGADAAFVAYPARRIW